jgi:regulator of cell morphogenesis and NO signaling
LIAHVVDHFHAGHRAELPRLVAMAEKVERVHGDKPHCPAGLAEHLRVVAHDLEQHMQKEEVVLFPMIVAGAGPRAWAPIQCMTAEHDEHGRALARTRELAHGFVPPPNACGTWRALYLGLAEFEREVMEHVHLENHVLFPRALHDAAATA